MGPIPFYDVKPNAVGLIDSIDLKELLSQGDIVCLIEKISLVLGEMNGILAGDGQLEIFSSMFMLHDSTAFFNNLGAPLTTSDLVTIEKPDDIKVQQKIKALQEYINKMRAYSIDPAKEELTLLKEISLFTQGFCTTEACQVLLEGAGFLTHSIKLNSDILFHQSMKDLFLRTNNLPRLIKLSLIFYKVLQELNFTCQAHLTANILFHTYCNSWSLTQKPFLCFNMLLLQKQNLYRLLLQDLEQYGFGVDWVTFFLKTFYEASLYSLELLKTIKAVRDEAKLKILELGTKIDQGADLLDYMCFNPVITVNQAATHLGIAFVTANTLLQRLTTCGVLEEQTGLKRNRVFQWSQYLALFV